MTDRSEFIVVDTVYRVWPQGSREPVAVAGKAAIRADRIEVVRPCAEEWALKNGVASEIVHRIWRPDCTFSVDSTNCANKPEDIARLLGARFVGKEEGGPQ